MSPLSSVGVPAGRLVRLGIVLDADERAPGVARLCDRAGIDVVWLADRPSLVGSAWVSPPAEIVEAARIVLERSALGVLLGPDEVLGLAAATELTVGFGDLSSGRSGGPLERRSIAVRTVEDIGEALARSDGIVLEAWRFADLETAADEVRAVAMESGRRVDALSVAALLPVSIGRTQAEAEARVAADPIFVRTGHPAAVGIFGTLEECQDRVIALAHAGVTELRCLLPATMDIHDVIAQLTAMTVGTTDVLIPGSLRSPAPPPPEGWGGRSPLPDRPRVSDGSRRR